MTNSPSTPSIFTKEDCWLASKEAADYIGVKTPTLSAWRMSGKGPPYSASLGRDPRYRLSDLQKFMEANLVNNSAEARHKRRGDGPLR